jgi:hypothetical protein
MRYVKPKHSKSGLLQATLGKPVVEVSRIQSVAKDTEKGCAENVANRHRKAP